MNANVTDREVQEAIEAGERALQSLRAAEDCLSSAGNWGIFDMLGGGFFTSMIKHSKMSNASSYIEGAKHDLLIFQRELRDVSVNTDIKIEVGEFLTFADFFFDGLVADYLVQSKIRDTEQEVKDAILQVETILNRLRSC